MDEAALASWTFPTRDAGRARWFFAGAFRDEVAGGRTLTFAFVVRGVCREVRGGRGDGTSCHGRGTGGRVPSEDFDLDPALRAGRLVFRERGTVEHEVVWEAARRTVPYGYMAGEACSEGTGEGAGMQRPAVAGGRVFGRKVPRDAVDHAVLARGAMVTECTRSIPPRTLRRAASGKIVRVFFPDVR